MPVRTIVQRAGDSSLSVPAGRTSKNIKRRALPLPWRAPNVPSTQSIFARKKCELCTCHVTRVRILHSFMAASRRSVCFEALPQFRAKNIYITFAPRVYTGKWFSTVECTVSQRRMGFHSTSLFLTSTLRSANFSRVPLLQKVHFYSCWTGTVAQMYIACSCLGMNFGDCARCSCYAIRGRVAWDFS